MEIIYGRENRTLLNLSFTFRLLMSIPVTHYPSPFCPNPQFAFPAINKGLGPRTQCILGAEPSQVNSTTN